MDKNKEKLENMSDYVKEMLAECMEEMNWHERLIFKFNMKIDDIWLWILMRTKYRKYRDK